MPKWLKITLGVAAGVIAVVAIIVWFALWATSGLIEPIEQRLPPARRQRGARQAGGLFDGAQPQGAQGGRELLGQAQSLDRQTVQGLGRTARRHDRRRLRGGRSPMRDGPGRGHRVGNRHARGKASLREAPQDLGGQRLLAPHRLALGPSPSGRRWPQAG